VGPTGNGLNGAEKVNDPGTSSSASPQTDGTDVGRRTALRVLVGLVLLGAALRLVELGAQSFWVDELLTIKAAAVNGDFGVRDFLSNIQGPFHAWLVHVVARVSTSEAALRSVSAVAGIAMIPVVYLLGRDMTDRRTGLVAAGLAAVSPFAIWYSQEVRNYSLLMLLSASSTLAAWRIVARDGRARWGYVASTALALYCNLSAAFLWLAQSLFAVGRLVRQRRFAQWVVVCVVVAALAAPMLLALTNWVRDDNVAERVRVAPLTDEGELLRGGTTFSPMAIPYSIYSMVYGYALGPGTRELHSGSPLGAFVPHLWLAIPAGLVAALGLLAGMRELWRLGALRGRDAAGGPGDPGCRRYVASGAPRSLALRRSCSILYSVIRSLPNGPCLRARGRSGSGEVCRGAGGARGRRAGACGSGRVHVLLRRNRRRVRPVQGPDAL